MELSRLIELCEQQGPPTEAEARSFEELAQRVARRMRDTVAPLSESERIQDLMRRTAHSFICGNFNCSMPRGDCERIARQDTRERFRKIMLSLFLPFWGKDMPIDVSKFSVTLRDKTPVTFTLLEDDEVAEETINVYHRVASTEVLKGLEEIEGDGVTEPPVVTRQLIFLDLRSPDLTKGGKAVALTAETLAEVGLPAQQVIARAIMYKSESFAPLLAFRPAPSAKSQLMVLPVAKEQTDAAQSDTQTVAA
ncbi:MAG: hypothetical protein WBP93_04530 [Pyrinomonadaceae bacterium]